MEWWVIRFFMKSLACATIIASILSVAHTKAAAAELPRLVTNNGRHALMVDGKPFLILGGQIHNSSNYPSVLPRIWPVLRSIHANTIEAPVSWEQLEPVEGRFDFTWVDALIREARANDMRVVLLWFGSWKNGESTYTPEWVKSDTRRFPRLQARDGRPTLTLSPFGEATLQADIKAFTQLMRHLRQVDPQHTVIMVQIENEVGTHGVARDYSPAAERLFTGNVPAAIATAAGKPAGTWSQAFGKEADQSFAAWSYARYIEQIAIAGKAEKRLPMYVNAAVFNPFNTAMADTVGSGGPNWNVIPIWKAAAPSLDMLAPDLYSPDPKTYLALLDRYTRADNALFVPESGNGLSSARYFWGALGRGAIGWAPFGMDASNYSNYPLGARTLDAKTIEAYAALFRLFRPIASDWAAIASTRPTWGSVKAQDAEQSKTLGRWRVTASYGRISFDVPAWPGLQPPPWASEPVGGGVVAQLSADEFLIAGQYVRLRFAPVDASSNMQIMSAEEGTFVDGQWRAQRRWNGDQITSGFNFNEQPALLRVRLATFTN